MDAAVIEALIEATTGPRPTYHLVLGDDGMHRFTTDPLDTDTTA